MCGQFVQLNEAVLKTELRELVRRTVEDTLNGLLDAEAEQLTGAARYERTEARQGYRSGAYNRGLTTSAGQLTLSIPRLKGLPFQTAIIERYRRAREQRGRGDGGDVSGRRVHAACRGCDGVALGEPCFGVHAQ